MEILKKILFFLLLLLLVFPALQKRFRIFKPPSLHGYYETTASPAFSRAGWFSKGFQQQAVNHIEDSSGFRSDLVRLYNQVDYSLFGEVHAAKILAGRKDYLFGRQMIDTWTGKKSLGRNYAEDKARKLKILQDSLLVKKGIFLLLVIAPNKASFYPEYIPARFKKQSQNRSNYQNYLDALEPEGASYIDFNRFLTGLKNTSDHILFPKTGSHWSMYGAYLAADSLARYLEQEAGLDLPEMITDSLAISGIPEGDDDDISKTLNLIWDVPHEPYTYPRFHFKEDNNQTDGEPGALFVGDSFYWQWYYPGIIRGFFRNTDFWYYNTDAYPAHFETPSNVWNISLDEMMDRVEVVILLQGMAGSGKLGFGFVDRAYEEYCGGDIEIKKFEDTMRSDSNWYGKMKDKAKAWKVGIDEAILIDAIYLRDNELQKEQTSVTK